MRAALAPAGLQVIDDSHLHAGHAGAREGRHYTVRITAQQFAGLSRIARHRLIYYSLQSLFPRHPPLAIQATAPGEASGGP